MRLHGDVVASGDRAIEVLRRVDRQSRLKPEVHTIDVKVPTEPDSIPFPVLGRKPFFCWYDIQIRERKEEIIPRGIYS